MRRWLIQPLLIGALALSLGAGTATSVNLLKNGELAEPDAKNAPKGWTVTAEGQELAVDTAEKPEGAVSSFRVDIKVEGEAQGSISQKIKDIPPNVKLVFTAQVKATADGVAFLQVKGKAAKKEIIRENSEYATGTDWQELRLEFDSGEATELSVQCRFRQGDEGVGQSVWFTNLQLTQAE